MNVPGQNAVGREYVLYMHIRDITQGLDIPCDESLLVYQLVRKYRAFHSSSDNPTGLMFTDPWTFPVHNEELNYYVCL